MQGKHSDPLSHFTSPSKVAAAVVFLFSRWTLLVHAGLEHMESSHPLISAISGFSSFLFFFFFFKKTKTLYLLFIPFRQAKALNQFHSSSHQEATWSQAFLTSARLVKYPLKNFHGASQRWLVCPAGQAVTFPDSTPFSTTASQFRISLWEQQTSSPPAPTWSTVIACLHHTAVR